MTKIEENNPLNLWLANAKCALLASFATNVESLLANPELSDRDKLTNIRWAVETVRMKEDLAMLENTYEGKVGALTR